MTPFITIRTHKGLFHADEVFACAQIQLDKEQQGGGELPIRRLNSDERENDEFAFVLDTMRVYDPEKDLFDHHQFDPRNPQPELIRGNGIPYATAGLVWKRYGISIVGPYTPHCNDIVARVDKTLFEQIDGHDADSTFEVSASSSGNEVRITTLSNIISSFNTDDIHDDIAQHQAFLDAVAFAKLILRDAINKAKSYVRAKNEFQSIITLETPEIIFLPKFLPWKEIVRENYPDVRFVITNSSHIEGEYALLAVPVKPQSRELLIPIRRPNNFDGFIHAGKFIAGCKSYAEAVNLALYNLEG